MAAMNGRMGTILAVAVAGLLLSGCFVPGLSLHRRNETLWASASAEYTAVTLQTYANARHKLPEALADPRWTACVEQTQGYEGLPPAIIIDLDETVLDNREFQMQLIDENREFDEARWNEWVRENPVAAIPGALGFLREAERLGVEIFYVTNRTADVEEPTRLNLEQLGLRLNPEIDTVLSKQEQPDWGREKTSRRILIAGSYRVLLMVGDNLADFVEADGQTGEVRRDMAFAHEALWGEKWFMLPNPLYGGWVTPTLEDAQESK